MARLEVVPFSDDHLDEAAGLLAQRHERHRRVEPLLVDVGHFRAQVERDWRSHGTSGAAAFTNGRLVGYLIGRRRDDELGAHLWAHLAGHAATEPEHVRDLYAFAARRWVEDGLTRHFVFVPPLAELVEPWFRLSFGASAALGARETARELRIAAGIEVRPGTPQDLASAARLERLLWLNNLESPSFSGLDVGDEAEFATGWPGTWEDERFEHFVAERDGRIVGQAVLYRRPSGDLRVRPDSIDLASVTTEPELRGTGIATALTTHALTWAHEHGYPVMITDWRLTNLVASRFWPRRGFRETFLRLYRSIP